MTRKIAVVVFPNFQLLDAAGPISAFDIAGRFRPGAYEIHVLAPGGGHTPSSAAAGFATEDLSLSDWDTILVSGGDATKALSEFAEIVTWLQRAAPGARRVTSVCSGAYFLAEAGLLDGRRATTHWSTTDHFARRYPKIRLEADRIFIRDGSVWTSGGITAGIDLTLALIEDDLGPEVARRTAQQLVVHQRRPGGQSQFSALVEMGGASGRFGELMDWMRANLAAALTVERLAEQAAMSPRNFARAFTAETGTTPAKAVERLRLEAARTAVETGHAPIDRVAETVGFGDPERMRRAFLRAFGQPPQALRRAARA
jgi:transcriptional regulator GlxA family with amidase domain